MKKGKTKHSLILLTLFLLPIVSKIGDPLFHHHNHKNEHHNSSINITHYHDKCLVFQYELIVFDPKVVLPKVEIYLNIISEISDLITLNVGIDSFELIKIRAPPFNIF